MIAGYEGTAEQVAAPAGGRHRRRSPDSAARPLGEEPGRSWAAGRFHGAVPARLAARRRRARRDAGDRDVLVAAPGAVRRRAGRARGRDRSTGAPALVLCHVSHVYETGGSLYFTVAARAGRRPARPVAGGQARGQRRDHRRRRDDHPPPRRRHRPPAVAGRRDRAGRACGCCARSRPARPHRDPQPRRAGPLGAPHPNGGPAPPVRAMARQPNDGCAGSAPPLGVASDTRCRPCSHSSRRASASAPAPRRTRSRARAAEDGKGPEHLGHLRHEPGRVKDGADRRRGLRPLPPLRRGHRADARPGRRQLPVLDLLAAGPADGRGPPTPPGLAFYDRLIDGLLDAGIEPDGHALPLGPAAGARGRRRLAQPRHRRTGSPSTPPWSASGSPTASSTGSRSTSPTS